MHRAVSFALLALLACLSVARGSKAYEYLQDVPFSVVKSQPQQRLVVFYFGSDPAAAPVLDMVDQTAEYLSSLSLPKLRAFAFAKVDCESAENRGECEEAGFKDRGVWMFTSTPHEGIQAYQGARDTPTLATHIRHKFLPFDAEDVLLFESETALFERMDKSDRDPPKPIMVKFWEEWCTHCKQLKLPYDQAATFFKDQVEFMECECSKNEATKSFCASNGIQSYPTLILFDGEQKHAWDQPDRTITSFQNFFLSKLPEDRYTKVVDKEAAALPPPPGVSATSSEEKPRPASTTTKDAAAKKADRQATKKGRGAEEDEEEDERPAKKKKKAGKGKGKKRSRRDEDEEEEDRPRRRSRRRSRREDNEDDEDEAPRRRRRSTRRRRRDDDDDEDDEPRRRRRGSRRRSRRDEDDDEDDEPRRRRSGKGKKGRKRAPDDEEEEEEAQRKKSVKKKQATQDLPMHDEL